MNSAWKLAFAVILVAVTLVCTVQGYQLGGVTGAIGGAVVGVLASIVGWRTFDLRRSPPE
jgi:membrane associated rhomboid family serine protease